MDFIWFTFLSKIVYKIIIYNGKYRKRHNSFKNIPIVKVKKKIQPRVVTDILSTNFLTTYTALL